MTIKKPVELLLVDDSMDDIFLTKEALKDNGIILSMNEVYDGEQALKYMRAEAPYENRHLPDLILLDINMPKKNGLEVLKELKEDDRFKHIPIIILTTSRDDEEIMSAYKHHCACFVSKPMTFDGLQDIVKSLDFFWLTLVTFPKED